LTGAHGEGPVFGDAFQLSAHRARAAAARQQHKQENQDEGSVHGEFVCVFLRALAPALSPFLKSGRRDNSREAGTAQDGKVQKTSRWSATVVD